MNALSVNPVSPAALAALAPLRAVQPLGVAPAQAAPSPGFTTGPVQDLAQNLFLRSLQAATLSPLAEPTTGATGLFQDTTAALLASLTTTQAPAATTATTTTTTTATDTTSVNPATVAVQAMDSTAPSTAPPSAPPVTPLADPSSVQDGFATSLSPDFAAQAALRFGAGVGAQAALAVPASDLGAGLVRDAARVLPTENLQSRTGGPGPEAFTQTQAAVQRVLRSYEASATGPATGVTATVDLFA